jgi:hypothetical protein
LSEFRLCGPLPHCSPGSEARRREGRHACVTLDTAPYADVGRLSAELAEPPSQPLVVELPTVNGQDDGDPKGRRRQRRPRGAKLSVHSSGRVTQTLSLPGSGISHTKTLGPSGRPPSEAGSDGFGEPMVGRRSLLGLVGIVDLHAAI